MSEISLSEIQTWHVDALKEHCRKRGLKVSGSKAELQARVFSAIEMCIAIQLTAEERIKITEEEKKALLLAPNNTTLPDPFSLHDGWLREEMGLTNWPPIFLSDITIYLMSDHPGKDVELNERLLNEYKEGKSYRLYVSGFLKEVHYHSVSSDSLFCFMKAKCTHSQAITDTYHNVWICAEKASGKIITAYCSCIAGTEEQTRKEMKRREELAEMLEEEKRRNELKNKKKNIF